MTPLKNNRAFISTATAFTFIPTLITSLFLLFHAKFPGIMEIHKWVGLAFIILCVCHIPINWAVLKKHLGKPAAFPALALAALLTVSMLLVGITNPGGNKSHRNLANTSGHAYAKKARW